VFHIGGGGRTILPGLVDCHTHAFGNALERALHFGVTAELDMFTDPILAQSLREEQIAGPITSRADIWSAGVPVSVPGGHGTQFGVPFPLFMPDTDATKFVSERVKEGSDWIKIMLESGVVWRSPRPTLSEEQLAAIIRAAHQFDKFAITHIGTQEEALTALANGCDGLAHSFADDCPIEDIASRFRAGTFLISTLGVIAALISGGHQLNAALVAALQRRREVLPNEIASLFSPREPQEFEIDLRHARSLVLKLHQAGIPILCGTDAPNPGAAHGLSMHRELELLVEAGLSPVNALASATSVPAEIFGLEGHGRILPESRANLLLVDGDPTSNISDTQQIVGVWKEGHLVGGDDVAVSALLAR
jgi:imidazolonepropionase-like amidohydrolase